MQLFCGVVPAVYQKQFQIAAIIVNENIHKMHFGMIRSSIPERP